MTLCQKFQILSKCSVIKTPSALLNHSDVGTSWRYKLASVIHAFNPPLTLAS